MRLDLEGKVVLITGSSRGIGKAVALAFERQGALVAINGLNQKNLDAAQSEFCTAPLALCFDVTKPDEARQLVEDVVKHFGRIDIVVANVGSGRSVPPGDETYEEWQTVFATNFFSATNLVEASQKYLTATGGSIICMSSICGCEVIPNAPITYSAAKAALNAYVSGIARPLGKLGIRIVAVAPGNVVFDGSVWEKRLSQDPQGVAQMLDRDVPLGRIANVTEIADVVVFAASARGAFATGSVWVVDGGQTRHFH
jgi:3-oxoacyl-[acyl-carrier protein] reductase